VRELLEGTEGIIVDESHVLPAGSFYRVAMATPRAYYRVGLSGTPLARTDKRSALAIGALGPVIYRISAEQLVAEGVLARPKVRMVTVTQSNLGGVTWQGVYGNGVVKSTKRNAVLASVVQRAEKPCLLFVKELRHGRELEKRLSAMGLHVDFTHGQHSTDWRRNMVKSLVAGRLDVVICTVVFQEGVDIPELRSVVIGSGGESVIAALQRVGRGTRKTADKDEFEVWDIADRGNKWLEKHARARQHAYAAESFETIVEPESPAALVAARSTRTERPGE
jgi:superfamily II DNA or RNA helicase